jgi:hypothetical protein
MPRVHPALLSMVTALGAYFVAWAVGFQVTTADWSLAPQYFAWSWTGGGERVVFLQVFALVAAGMGALGGVLWGLARRPR